MTDWTKLVSGDELVKIAKERKQTAEKITGVKPAEISTRESEGYKVVKTTKNGKATMEKQKKFFDVFENEVWMVFYKMGFPIMNGAHDIEIDLGGNKKKIDVLAMDDETCIFVECKATEAYNKTSNFKKELESINGYYKDLRDAVSKQYGKRKFKYIFATKNYYIADDSNDMERIKSFKLIYFDYDTVKYYDALADHLGTASRYQLLGNLFQNEDIPNIDNKVPAVKGKMGNKTYYSFLIEPEKLLKLGYVLHRNKANHLMMPTYQRLIKKDRLKSVRAFVNDGGYFANSLIVSIDSHGRGVNFDSAGKADGGAVAGTLHLPKKYRTMYIIDGQHRLYGYSDSDKAEKDFIPVVAFVDLPPEEQVKLFMEINENQKSVSKSLRNTLNIDLLWKSSDPKKRKEALMLSVAESLGENKKSPLFDRVLTGEDTTTEKRVITTEYIKDAIKHSSYLNEYDKNGIKVQGTIDKNDNTQTHKILIEFLIKCFEVIETYCSDEWNKDASGFLTINNTTYALIRMFDDILNLQLENLGESVVNDVDVIFKQCEPMLLDLADTINDLPQDKRDKIKTAKGGSAKKDSWRILEVALHEKNVNFINDELQTYIEEFCTDNNADSSAFVIALETLFKNKFKNKMTGFFNSYVPDSLAISIGQALVAKNVKRQSNGLPPVDEWEVISFDQLFKIGTHKTNWTDFAQEILSRPSMKNSQKNTLTWLKNLETYKTKVNQGKSLTKGEYLELEAIYNDFIETSASEKKNNGTEK